MQEILATYMAGVIMLLMMATRIDPREGLGLKPILVAAFAWPIAAPVIAWRAWSSR